MLYLDHFGLNDLPFRITPDTEHFFSGAQRGAMLEALRYAIASGEGIIKLVGEVGSGKTMLCRMLMDSLPASTDTIYIANPSLAPDEVLLAIAEELGIQFAGERHSTMIRAVQEVLIERYAAGRQVVVLIDEAHAMPRESLEEIRLLSNLETGKRKLLQLVLFAQPEIEPLLERDDMRQLKDRITHHFTLLPLASTDVGDYLMFRLRAAGYRGVPLFSRAAVWALSRASRGLTRRINVLADKALLATFASGQYRVGLRQVWAARRDLGEAVWPWRWSLALGVGGLLTALAVGAWWQPAATPVAPAPVAAKPAPVTKPAAPRVATFTEQLAAGRLWLQQQEASMITIQLLLSASREEPVLAPIMARCTAARLDCRLAEIHEGGQRWTGVFYGQFVSRHEALQALNAMPADWQQSHPVFRSFGNLQRALQ